MKLALSTLEGWANYDDWVWPESALEQSKRNTIEAITALRQALEEEREPLYWSVSTGWVYANDTSQERVDETAKQEHEPVAWMHTTAAGLVYFRKKPQDKVFNPQPVYTAPPKKEWVGLTADEIWKCNKAKSGSAVEFHICYEHQNVEDFAESIEAKLREKNT
jgi:hypothetical protein